MTDTTTVQVSTGPDTTTVVGSSTVGPRGPVGEMSAEEVQALVDAAVAGMVAGAPGALDTLNELAAALGDDANFAATVAASLAALEAADDDLALAIGTKVSTSDYEDADVLAKIKNVDGAGSGLDADLLDGADLSTDGTLAGNSDALVPSQKAVKTYADQLIAAADAMVFKGVIDASANPNYPAADKGHTYRISVAGKIGGAAGPNVEAGDLLVALADGVAAGNHATVGASWSIAQTNIDGAVVGPAVVTDGVLVWFNGTTGKVIKAGADTAFGRAWLALVDAAAARSTLELPVDYWLSVDHFGIAGGGPAKTEVAGDWQAWVLDASANEALGAVFPLPASWTTFAADLWWTNAGAGAGDVVWDLQTQQRGNGDLMNGVAFTSNAATVAAPAQNVLKKTTLAASITKTSSLLNIYMSRWANNAADTLANDAALVGLLLRRLT